MKTKKILVRYKLSINTYKLIISAQQMDTANIEPVMRH